MNLPHQADIDHEFTDEIVCPHCGHEHTDSFESPDEGDMQCHECKKKFEFSRNVEVTYSTEKL